MTAPRTASWPVLGVVIAAAFFFIDRFSKYALMEWVMRPEGVTETPFLSARIVELLPVFNLRMAWNTGISFSMFSSETPAMTYLLLAVQLGITCALVWYMWQQRTAWMQLATGLLVAGGLGNSYDRAIYGAVADFFDFHIGDWHFATFNVADACISIGIALWLLDAIRSASHHAPQSQPKD